MWCNSVKICYIIIGKDERSQITTSAKGDHANDQYMGKRRQRHTSIRFEEVGVVMN